MTKKAPSSGRRRLGAAIYGLIVVCNCIPTEEDRNSPQAREPYQRKNDTADSGTLATEEGAHQVKAEDPNTAPVKRTDNDKRQSQFIHLCFHSFRPLEGADFDVSMPCQSGFNQFFCTRIKSCDIIVRKTQSE